MKLNLRGLIAAPFTPMRADGSLALEVVERQADALRAAGVTGVFIGGTTGEWPSLSVEERLELFDAWAECGSGLVRIAHVGHPCRVDAIRLAAHAARGGMDATSAVAPSFLKPQGLTQLTEFFAPIAEAAPTLPFYVYHIPSLTGLALPPEEQLRACEQRIANFAGMKFTEPNLLAFARTRAACGDRLELVWGADELLLAALSYGAVGAVGSTYNLAAPLYLSLIEAFERGDLRRARRINETVVAFVDVLVRYGVIRAGKALLTRQGIECGPPRSPLAPLDDAEQAALFAELDRLATRGERPLDAAALRGL